MIAVLLSAVPGLVLQAADPHSMGKNLGDLSLEELMNETVTSVAKKEQRLGDAAAAVSVVSNDDIRRSGASSLPDVFRLVPGMDVASINSSQSAVSVRGFNSIYANKLLVLVDGRAVYSPTFAGVFWDLQQTMLEDVDRIEVIRGPGATLWGANAVNGVINVVLRSARDTQGGLIYGGGGDVQESLGGLRYGGRLGDHTYYRVFAGEKSQDDYPLANGQPASDNWSSEHGGFRMDSYQDETTHFTWQAETTATDYDNRTADAHNTNTLARLTHTFSARSSIEAQAYFDRTDRDEPQRAATAVDTFDFTLQHSFAAGERHDLIWGVGYRYIHGDVTQTGPAVLVRNPHFRQHLSSAFMQDEIKLVPDSLTLTLGTKIEHNDYTGFEIQPSVSMAFKPMKTQTLWAKVSRAVRTPTVLEGRNVVAPLYGEPFVGPGGGIYVPTLTGNRDLSSETLWAYELGWRLQPNAHVNVDVALFYNDYRKLTTPDAVSQLIPGVPFGTAELPWTNHLSGHTYGGESSVTVSPVEKWRLTAAYSLLLAQIKGPAFFAEASEEGSPRHQASLRSAYDFNARLSLDGQFRYVDSVQGVPAYHTVDLRLSYRPNDRLEFALIGENLLDPQHPEQASAPLAMIAEVPRSLRARVVWHF